MTRRTSQFLDRLGSSYRRSGRGEKSCHPSCTCRQQPPSRARHAAAGQFARGSFQRFEQNAHITDKTLHPDHSVAVRCALAHFVAASVRSVAIGYALSLTSRMGGARCLSQSDAFSRYRFTPTIHFPRLFFARACYSSRKNGGTVPKTVPVSSSARRPYP